MKKTSFALLLALIIFNCLGQDARVVKLEKQLKAHPQQDTFRVNRLNELGKLRSISTGKLDSIATEMIVLSQKLNYPDGEIYGFMKKAMVAAKKNDTTQALSIVKIATAKAELLSDKGLLSYIYTSTESYYRSIGDNKKGLFYALKAEEAANRCSDKVKLITAQINLADLYSISLGNFPKSMEWALKAQKTAEDINSLEGSAYAWVAIASAYSALGEQAKSLTYYQKALEANRKLGKTDLQTNILNHIGERYRLMGNYPEALKAYQQGLALPHNDSYTELNESNMADVYVRMGNLPLGFKCGFSSLAGALKIKDLEGEEWIRGILARAYLKKNNPDSAIYHANIGYQKASSSGTLEFMRDNSLALSDAYAMKKNYGDAYSYYKQYISYRDSMFNQQATNQTALLQYDYDLAKKQAQITTLNEDKKAQRNFLIAASVVIGLIIITMVVLFRNNRQKQKAYDLLTQQKHIIEDQRDKTNKALADLQLTQTQLVQSEKMASLGELTAGIAHEIQNPLNFVNNFADVNKEMLGELEEELKQGNTAEALSIAAVLKENEEKIIHHGKRADSIVKGMLQHSRASSTTKEATDINKLADEYLRLAYHGLRAKDKSFNADMETHFAANLPEVNVVPQDIGRVLLNMFTNAFYTVNQKKKTAGEGYKPTITLTTFAPTSGGWGVKVKDNGNGIPDSIKDKIMQPFFTTKPTGEGTGLGLSLSYDIVVKGHGGIIDINSKEGEYTEFILTIPA